MSISLMKIFDEYIGRVIVFFISIFRSKKNKSESDSKKNILFIKFWGIGSIILTVPALNKVRAAYPDSKIFFLTLASNLDVCKEINIIDEAVTVDISNPFSFISDFIGKIKLLRKTNFDIAFDFEFFTYFSAIIVSLLKINKSFGFDNLKNKRKIIFTNTICFNQSVHTKENFLNLVNEDFPVNSNSIVPSGFTGINVAQKYTNGEFKITVNPNASKLALERRLPKENFIELIDHITKEYRCKVLLIGSKDETEYVENIYNRLNNKNCIINLCGKTSAKELISLIKESNCLITNDSGPLHIASAFNTPVIAFFGPESPQRYGPLSEKNLIFYKNLECSPCMSISNSKTVNCIYDSPKCMGQFEMNDVLKKIDLFIEELIEIKKYQSLKWSKSI